MKKQMNFIILCFLAFIIGSSFTEAGSSWYRSLAIGNPSSETTALFEVQSTTKGSVALPVMTETQRDAITSPADGLGIYNSTSNAYNFYNGTNWAAIGAGSGTGSKNYLTDGDFEGNISLATTYDDTGAYVDGADGSPTVITISQNSTTPLRDTEDLKITKAASDGSGEGVTLLSESINRIDQGRQLYFKAQVDFTDSNYTSGDVCIKAYDVAGAAILAIVTAAGLDDDGCFTRSKGAVLVKVLTTSSTTGAVRVSLHLESDSATGSAWSVYVDDSELGPDGVVPGAIMADLGTEAWTDSEANSTTSVKITRKGNRVFIDGIVTVTGVFAGSQFDLTIPAKYTPDSTEYSLSSRNYAFGRGKIFDGGTVTSMAEIRHNVASELLIQAELASGTYLKGTHLTASVPHVWLTGDYITFKADWIVQDWLTSSSISTTENFFSTVTARHTADTSTAQSVPTAAATVIDFQTEDYDAHNMWQTGAGYTAGTGVWTTEPGYIIPKSGKYFINSNVTLGAMDATNDLAFISIYVNGSPVSHGDYNTGTDGTQTTRQISDVLALTKNDVVTILIFHGSTGAEVVRSGNGDLYSWFTISEFPDRSVYSIYGVTEIVETITADANYTATADVWGDAGSSTSGTGSIDLTPGVWDISALGVYGSIGGVSTTTNVWIGIGTTAGNNNPGNTGDQRVAQKMNNASGGRTSLSMHLSEVIVTTDATYYLKTNSNLSTTNIDFAGKITARRIK